MKDKTISDSTHFYEMSIKETKDELERNIGVVIFWIVWIIVMVLAVFGFYYIDNEWLEYKHSVFMYHQMYCWRDGKYQDLVEDREEDDWLNKQIEEYVINRTNFTKNVIDDIREKKKDFYIHSDEAVKYGIVD